MESLRYSGIKMWKGRKAIRSRQQAIIHLSFITFPPQVSMFIIGFLSSPPQTPPPSFPQKLLTRVYIYSPNSSSPQL